MTALLQAPENNTFKLPRGERLRREQARVFREQRNAILRFLRTGTKHVYLRSKDEQEPPTGPGLPWAFPSWEDFRLGALKVSQRMTPILSAVWDAAGQKFSTRVGLDPDEWSVTNPHTAGKIHTAALDFCQDTNATTSDQLDRALARTRQELTEGIVEQGEALPKLTKRVQEIFDGAEKWRARRIAQTETSRAVHAAQDEAARLSGVVTGWRWLASADACEVCLAIVARCPAIKLGGTFAVIGHNPTYQDIRFPPAHPNCNCSVTEVLDTDPQPTFHATLIQPEAATYSEIDKVAVEHQELINSIFPPGRKPPIPTPAVRPKPPIRIRRRQPTPSEAPSEPDPVRIIEPPVEIAPYDPPSGPGEEIADPIEAMPLEHFAQHAITAAQDVPIDDRMGWDKRKIWIIDAWRQFHRMFPAASIKTFKRQLVEANQDRLVTLARSDLPQYLSSEERQKQSESTTRQGRVLFHFLRLEGNP